MKLMIIIVILCLSGASSKESVIKGRNKSKNKLTKPKNVCTLEPSEIDNIRCLCTKEKFQRASSAECWIFGPVTKEHFIWELIVKTQPYLSDLNIVASNQGSLKIVPEEFVHNMSLLKNLTISFAVLERLEKYAFGNSSSLEILKLSKNQIQFLDAYAISNLPSLREIYLDENRIQTIPLLSFSNLTQLHYVQLNSNNITKVEDRAFSSMSHVLEMDLSENYICGINNLTFFGLSKLKVIDLSFNRITSLESSVFSELWDIEELYLDHNFIEFISNRAFDGLRFLKTISLSNNRLSRFPAGLFTSVFTLFNLDISNNRLETLIFDSIEQLYNNLINNGTIRLKGNRFSCDCRLDWVYVLREKTTQSSVRNSLEELQCLLQPDKITTTTETYENIGCPPMDKAFLLEHQFSNDRENAADYVDEENNVFLMSISLAHLPCPPELRPTPITIKQGTTRGPETSSVGIYFARLHVICLVVPFMYLM